MGGRSGNSILHMIKAVAIASLYSEPPSIQLHITNYVKVVFLRARVEIFYLTSMLIEIDVITIIYLLLNILYTAINLTKNTLSRLRTASTFGCFQFGGDTFRNKFNKMADRCDFGE